MSNLRYKAIIDATGAWLEDVETGQRMRPLIGAKGDVNVPPPTPQETALQKANLELINQQKALTTKQQQEYEAMVPYLYKNMGYNFVKDPKTGQVTINPMSDQDRYSLMTEEERQTADIRKLANERTKRALEGNLDVDPAVESDIARGEQQLRSELMRKLGPGAEGSDSWNRAMAEYNKQMNMVRYSVRHGEMTTADAIGSNRANESMRRQEQLLRNMKGGTEGYAIGANLLSGATGATEGALSRMYGQRVDAADLALQNQSRKDAFWGGITQGAMGLAGAGMGAGAMIAV